MNIIYDLQTCQTTIVPLTPEEIAAFEAARAAEQEYNSSDNRATRAINCIDRLQFECLFDLENRVRVLENKPTITKVQYRDALIARWKILNP